MKELSEEVQERMKRMKPYRGKNKSITHLSQFAAGQITVAEVKKLDKSLYEALATDNTPQVFSYNFYRAMYERGWSTSEMAKRLGLHRNLMTLLQKGNHLPQMQTVVDVSKKLNMPFLEFFSSPIKHPAKTEVAIDRLEEAVRVRMGDKKTEMKASIEEARRDIQKRIEKLIGKLNGIADGMDQV